MAVINDPKNAFNFAYKGFQYPLPPTWKRAIRLEDQIQWLLQALLYVNDNGINIDKLTSEIDSLNKKLSQKIADSATTQKIYTDSVAGKLQKEINAIVQGDFIVTDPTDGKKENASEALKHLLNYLLIYGATYAQVKAFTDSKKYTYAELQNAWSAYNYKIATIYAGNIIGLIEQFAPIVKEG